MDPAATALEAAYLATAYQLDAPKGRIVLRIGRASAELDRLLSDHAADAWAFLTAYNPGSRPIAPEENAARQEQLEKALTEAAYPFFCGAGVADDGAWPPEPSLLVVGIAEAEAVKLARRFGQRAIVCGVRGGPARLVWVGA